MGGIHDQLSTDPPLVDVMEGVAWRTIVHSLNILRLIILDATLGPDLHPFIAQATKIAVRGFQSPLWAIRNSSMMVEYLVTFLLNPFRLDVGILCDRSTND